ncbi:hypothetical protein M501DRAFT_999949 [Patellaria atrata CBS 101060]|uniref:Zn(2)-C6 fungal-type domain-containing protein n=1 Tax=Patellaria atrata CBS 101060 TaxID=1346257 RepID=A0A9P4S1V4_9PEZI|nr:hypothetical protein M501DRAFT_999949 [Patellaria atrata CBS 101060]
MRPFWDSNPQREPFEGVPIFEDNMMHTGVIHPHPQGIPGIPETRTALPILPNHRLSVGSSNDYTTQHMRPNSIDGTDQNTSPESGHAYSAMSPAKRDDKGDPAPAWSEMKTKAGKDRKRLPLACMTCRKKKIRCSGESPSCKHCLKSHIPCTYKTSQRKAAPRTEYMAMLDKRLKKMEDRVLKLVPKEHQGAAAAIPRAVVKPALPSTTPKSATFKKRPAQEAFAEELDEWAKQKAAGAASEITGLPPKTSEVHEESNLLTEGREDLPPKDIQEHLAEVYFNYVYGQSYPLLHKPSFMRKLAAGLVPPVLILSVCAIAARFSTHPHVRTDPPFLRGEKWAATARGIALKRYDTPNITILICYLLLGLHEFGTCQGGRSWMFGGMAQRMAYALQLHKDVDRDPSGNNRAESRVLSSTDREIRRRTMWSCFLMDRFNSSGTDRPIFVSDQCIQVQLPIKESYFQMELFGPTEDLDGNVPKSVEKESTDLPNAKENMGVTSYLVRLVALWGRLVKYMNFGGKEREAEPIWSVRSTFHELKTQARNFKASLPSSLEYNAENLQTHASEKTANQFLYLHVTYHQTILFLHRFALPSTANSRPPSEMPHQFLAESARVALDAAKQISLLVKECMEYPVSAPFVGYCAFFASTVHVHGVFSNNAQLEAASKEYLTYNVKFLTKIKKYWGMFHYVAENLKELYKHHADAANKGSSATEGKIFQYGDWFDRYPHGVSQTDYEDPAPPPRVESGTDAVLGHKADLQSVEEFFASLSPPSKAEKPRRATKKTKQSKLANISTDNKQGSGRRGSGKTSISPTTMQNQQQQQTLHRNPNLVSQNSPFNTSMYPQQPLAPAALSHGEYNMIQHLNAQQAQGIGPSHNQGQQMPFSPINYMGFDVNGISNSGFADPSTAWFSPFNLEPPVYGDEGSGFGAFGGYGFEFPQFSGPGVDQGRIPGDQMMDFEGDML